MEIYISCKDHTVTHETFNLLQDPKMEMLITTPQPQNLDKYYQSEKYISHTDSKKSIMDKLYQYVKKINIRAKTKLIDTYSPQHKNLLDVGTGTGDFLVAAQKKGWTTLGVEPNFQASERALAKQINVVPNLKSVPQQKFDVITLWHVLEHLPDLEQEIKNLVGLLHDQGTLIIAVPNYKSYDAKYYKEYWAAYDVPRHLWHFSKKSIGQLFKEHQMKVIKTKPMLFDSFYVSLLSEKYKTGKINILPAIWIGFLSNIHGILKKEYSSQIYILQKNKTSI